MLRNYIAFKLFSCCPFKGDQLGEKTTYMEDLYHQPNDSRHTPMCVLQVVVERDFYKCLGLGPKVSYEQASSEEQES